MARPNRILRGEERSHLTVGKSKGKGLYDDDIRAIRVDPRPHLSIAQDYNISRPMVSMIKARKRWSHVRQHPNGCVIGASSTQQP